MTIEVIPARSLTTEQLDAWSQLQATHAELDSPFFHPRFTQSVARVRDDVQIAILYEQGAPVGFMPFQVEGPGQGVPVGGSWSDLHGAIAPPNAEWSLPALLARCGLAQWRFRHVPEVQQAFAAYQWPWLRQTSAHMDLAGGFDAYAARRKKTRGDDFPISLRRIHKLQRFLGPVRCELRTIDWRVLEALIDWKIQEYRRRRVKNLLGPAWCGALLQQISRLECESFGGVLSALYAGDRLTAVHLGLRSGSVLHSWVAAEDRTLARYAPGQVLLIEVAKAAATLGIHRIDLGRTEEPARVRLASGARLLTAGEIDLRTMASALRRHWSHTRAAFGATHLGRPVQRVFRMAQAWLFPG